MSQPAQTTTAPATPPSSTTPPAEPSTKTDGQVPVPAEGAPPAPPEAEKTPAFHKAFQGLAKQEKALLEKQKAFSASEKRNAQIESAYALAEKDPLASIEALGEIFGKKNLFELAATSAVSRKKVDPGITQALSEVDQLRQDLTVERAIPLLSQGADLNAIAEHLGVDPEKLSKVFSDKRYAGRVEQAQAAFDQQIENTLAHHAQEISSWVLGVTEPDGSQKYELIAALGAESKVFELISTHFEETLALGKPVQLTKEEAADILEQDLLNQARKVSGARKLRPPEPEKPAKKSTASQESAPKRTLSNSSSQESSGKAPPTTEKERLAAATALMEKLRRS